MKFRVESINHSKEIQEELFRLGYGWSIFSKKIKNINQPFLFAHNDNSIRYGNTLSEWESNNGEITTLEELKELSNFKKGDWVIYTYKDYTDDVEYLAKVESTNSDDTKVSEIYRGNSNRCYSSLYPTNKMRLATHKEIEDFLTREAKARGFVVGAQLEMTGINSQFKFVNGIINSYSYYKERDLLDSENGYIYKNGIWATLKKEEKLKFNNHNVKFDNDYVMIGCAKFKINELTHFCGKILQTNDILTINGKIEIQNLLEKL